jgi:hypothetical protein
MVAGGVAVIAIPICESVKVYTFYSIVLQNIRLLLTFKEGKLWTVVESFDSLCYRQ